MSIEQKIKSQYAKIFVREDWYTFKRLADCYIKNAAKLMKKDINIEKSLQLLGRNIQKRLFIGIGTELLLKAIYLKNGYCINKPNEGPARKLVKFDVAKTPDYDETDTYTLGPLIDNLKDLFPDLDLAKIKKGLNIAKVFRNKEGHVAVLSHAFDPSNYYDIEHSIKEIYKLGFQEDLSYKISIGKNDKAMFEIA